MGFNYQYDATQYDPNQGTPSHPVGKFPATVTNTSIVPTKNNDGGMFVVEFTTQAGKVSNRYNLWNANTQAVEIAHKQLSALCHSVGVFKLDMNNDGASLRNAQCTLQIGLQKGQPEGGYTEIQRVFDRNGNEPGKSGAGPQPAGGPAPQQQPMQAQSPAAPGWGPPQQGAGGPVPQQFGQMTTAPSQPAPAWGGPPQGQPQQSQPQWGAPPNPSQGMAQPGMMPGAPGMPPGNNAPMAGYAAPGMAPNQTGTVASPSNQPQWGAPQGQPQGGPAPGWSQGGAPAAPPWGPPRT